ncbi:MAG: collagen-like protein [bacterium]|nr:collagen-like protein [bacterium]
MLRRKHKSVIRDFQAFQKEKLRGVDGKDGIAGQQGDTGAVGERGERGPQGNAGMQGARGEKGEKGDRGEKGSTPAHQISNGELRFETSEGTWGKWIKLFSGTKMSTSGGGGMTEAQVVALIEELGEATNMYDKLIDTVGSVKYIGEALPSTTKSQSLWRIKRVDLTTDDVEIVWADGTSDFVKEWDERLTYDYTVEA